MINKNKILAIVPARGGSKTIKNKNIIKVKRKPLILYTLEEATKSKYLDRIIISTNSKKIAKVCNKYDVPFIRPNKLAEDHSLTIDAVFHTINYLKSKKEFDFNYIMLLQPTSPLRTYKDIDKSIKLLLSSKAESLISVVDVEANHPARMYSINMGFLKSIFDEKISMMPRQKLKKIYIRNGSIYLTSIKNLYKNNSFIGKKNISYIMPKDRSINIDTLDDLNIFKNTINK